jgi:hypothetical protein
MQTPQRSTHVLPSPARLVVVLTAALALVAGPLSDGASAGLEQEQTCVIGVVQDTTEFGKATTSLVRGRSYLVGAAQVTLDLCAQFPEGFQWVTLTDFTSSGVLMQLSRAGTPVAWSTFGALTGGQDADGAEIELYTPDDEPSFVGAFLQSTDLGGSNSAYFTFTLPADAPIGAYRIAFNFLESDLDLEGAVQVLIDLQVGDAPSARSQGPAATLTCDTSAPVVGSTVTCTVASGAPDFDILWTASTNPVLASGVVRTDATGAGRFSFVVPASARGQELLVELVDWTRPTSIGVVGGPIPGAIPAGEGSGDLPIGGFAMLLVAVLGSSAAGRLRAARAS